ncbi:MAG: vanadium-dependent haloperoxidase [Gammaproteobacteria bacterium]
MVPPNSSAPVRASEEAAAAAAAYEVLSALYPAGSADYADQLADDLADLGGLGRPKVADGYDWGVFVGQEVLALRANDGSSPQEILPGGTAPGQFRADFTSAQYRNMVPFGISDPTPYLSDGPPALDSEEYAEAFNEIKVFGERGSEDADISNQEAEELFRFWAGGGGSARPPGEWIKIAITVAEQRRTTKSISKTARLFALLGMSMGDSVVVSWNDKFDYQGWRPATAIHNADTDGNPDTVADPAWTQRNGSIGGSPEHTSGQSTFAGAGSTVLAHFYHRDHVRFSFEGDDSIAGPRSFRSFSQAAEEAGRARIYAGIHFEFSNQAGQSAGRGLANEIVRTRLKKLRGHGHSCP